jgi:folate-dependent phosphoribosylglycinamide formyltransferase PurN
MLTLDRRPRVAVLFSRRCPGLASLLAGHQRREFDLTCALTSEEDFSGRDALRALRIPLATHPIRDFYGRAGRPLTDLATRRDYDRGSVARLAPHRPDLLVLSSYLYLLTDPVLEAWPDRVVNVHASDLARTRTDGRPLYPGLRAVRDAIRAGEKETRATAHIVTAELDAGPILLRSRPFPVSPMADDLRRVGAMHALNAYAYAHQEWMLETAWGPLLTNAIALLAGEGARRRAGPVAAEAPLAARGAAGGLAAGASP